MELPFRVDATPGVTDVDDRLPGAFDPAQVMPLTPAQTGQWLAQELDPSVPMSVAQFIDIRGRLDVDILSRVASEAAREFGSGRIRLVLLDSTPHQIVDPAVETGTRLIDLRGDPNPAAAAHEWMRHDVEAPLDLLRDRLAVSALLQIADEHYFWYTRSHHIVLDGVGAATLMYRAADLYNAATSGTPPPPATADDLPKVHAAEAKYVGSSRWEGDRRYWLERTSGMPERCSLSPRSAAAVASSRDVGAVLDDDVCAALADARSRYGVSTAVLVAAAIAAYTARHTGGRDIMLSLPVSSRTTAVLRRSGGTLANVVPLRFDVATTTTVGELIADAGRELSGALRHQRYRHEDLRRDRGERGRGRGFAGPLLNLMLFPTELRLGDTATSLEVLSSGPIEDLLVNVYQHGANGPVRLDFKANPRLYDDAILRRHYGRFGRLLRGLLDADPGMSVGELPVVDEQEAARALAAPHAPASHDGAPIPESVVRWAEENADRVAVVSDGHSLTYRELTSRANRLARQLLALGVGPEEPVGVILDRDADLIVALLAVLLAGGAYVPIESGTPRARRDYVLADAHVRCVLTTSEVADDLSRQGIAFVVLDDPVTRGRLATLPDGPITVAERPGPLRPANAAYTIYTSGSTGRPKGVRVSHRSAADLLANAAAAFAIDDSDVWTMFHSYAFDFSVWEIWGALTTGGALVVVDQDTVRAPEAFVELLRREHVTVLNQTPAAFFQLAEAERATESDLPDLRRVFVGGDGYDQRRMCDWLERHDAPASLVSVYGITETTVFLSQCPMTPELAASGEGNVIGRGLPGVRLYLLDRWLHPVPVGVVGELYAGGTQVARGYVGRAGLTAERIVVDPFARDGTRMYRSGDLARWDEQGRLVFVGRGDFQVQVRGFRVEPGEIEAALVDCPGVAHAVVVPVRDGDEPVRLAGYVVPEAGVVVGAAEVREHLRGRLASYMLPAAVTILERLPLTVNGKVDRKALPAPDFGAGSGHGRAPNGVAEETLAGLFCQVLGVDTVDAEDSFFALGGDSIMAIQLVSRAREAGLTLTPHDVFEQLSVAGLAAVAKVVERPGAAPEAESGGVGRVEATPIVRWLLERGGPWQRLSQSVCVALPPGVRDSDLLAAVQALLDRHDMLRARFADGVFDVPTPGAVTADDVVRRLRVPEGDVAALARARDAATNSLDPGAGRMLAVAWCDAGPGRPGRLVLVVHHLVVDGVSWRILLPDLATSWQQATVGQVPLLPTVGTSMRRWSAALVERAGGDHAAEIAYWRNVLVGADPPLGTRPLDPGLDVASTVETVLVDLPGAVTEALSTVVPESVHGTVNDAMIAGVALATARWRGTSDVLVGVEAHGREDDVLPGADLSRTVGWFTTVHPVRVDLSGIDLDAVFAAAPEAIRALATVKEQLRTAPDHGLGYGVLRYLADRPDGAGALSGLREPQISVNYLGRIATAPHGDGAAAWLPVDDLGDLGAGVDPGAPAGEALDINLITVDTASGPVLRASFAYPAGVLDRARVTELADRWQAACGALAEAGSRPGVGGLTPSDLTADGIDQSTIVRLEQEHPGLADVWPLSPLQAGLLFQTQLAGDDHDPYLVQLEFDLRGRVDADRLRRSVQALLDRHEILRVSFTAGPDGDPVQLVPDRVELPWAQADLDEPLEVERVLVNDRARQFDMSAAPLLRGLLIRTGSDRHRLVLTYHHILLDGWSVPLLVRELLALYASNESAGLPAAPSFRNYLTWLGTVDTSASTSRWAEVLAGVDEPTLLGPSARGRQLPTVPLGERLRLGAEETARLDAAARARGVTLSTIVRAAWGIVLGAWTRRDDVVFGAIVSGRPPQIDGIESMVGLFINTIPVRVRLRPGETLGALLDRCQAEQTALLDHEHVGLADIERATGAAVLFDTITVFESYPVDRGGLTADTDIAGVRVGDVTVRDATHYPFALAATVNDGLEVRIDYAPGLFERADVEAVSERLGRVLRTIAADVDITLAELQLLSDEEYRLLTPVHGRPGPPRRTLARILTDAATVDPAAPALTCGDRTITYRDLDAVSNRMARWLIADGVGPESVVALGLTRSVEFVQAVWAVAKTGAAFVPVDPTYPADRISHMLGDSGALAGLTVRAHRAMLSDEVPWRELDADDYRSGLARFADHPVTDADRTATVRIDNAAYLIYTSGSTGTPKGVVLTHRGLGNLVAQERESLTVTADSRVSQFTSPSFDASVFELLMAFGSGAHLMIAPPDVLGGPDLARQLAGDRDTHAFFTPSVLDSFEPDGLDALQSLALAGERCPPELVGRWATERHLFNAYGPTEGTIMSNIAGPLAPDEPVTIGGPTLGFVELVLDARLQPVPIGIPGELYLGGPAIARGYHRRPSLTAERFVASPFVSDTEHPTEEDEGTMPGDRLYRTGDIVRWKQTEAGLVLEYLGRSDFQVKVRGFRIELGEIDAALAEHPGVEFAATLGRTAPSGESVLVSYVRSGDDPAVDAAELTRHLAARLPAHMVPALIVSIDDVPLTPAGKLDQKALPQPHFPSRADTTVPSAPTPVEEIVAEHLRVVLGIDRIGLDDSFFDLGGNSLMATRVIRRLDAALDADLDVRALFEAPTVRGLAALAQRTAGDAHRPVLRAYPWPQVLPLSSAQLRMWSINQLDPESPAYNIVMAVRLHGDLDVEALLAAVGDVVERHASLRTTYPVVDGTPAQKIVDAAELAAPAVLSVVDDEELTHLLEFASGGFDVSREVPLRAELLRVSATEHVLVVVAHHISADGFSMTALGRDVLRAYESRREGVAPPWEPPEVTYVDFALWQRDLLGSPDDPGSLYSRQLDYWRRILDGVPDFLPLPTDRPRPARQSLRGATVGFVIDGDQRAALADLAHRGNATMFMVAHAALAVLVARMASTDDAVIGTPVSGRGEAALDDVVGMFVGTLVLRTPMDLGDGFADVLHRVRDTDLGAFAHTDLPFERLVDELAPVRSTSYAPLFQVLIEYRTDMSGSLRLPGIDVEPVTHDLGISKFDLQLSVSDIAGAEGAPAGMRFDLTYATDLWDATTAEGFAERLRRILAAAAFAPHRPVGDVDLLTAGERESLTAPATGGVDIGGTTLADVFGDTARRCGAARAVAAGEATWTYDDLAASGNRLARLLVARGVGPESVVALALPRSPEMIAAIVAVTVAGGAYLPVDLGSPPDRIALVLGDAEPACVVTTTGARGGLGDVAMPVVVLDDAETASALDAMSPRPLGDADRVAPLHPSNTAYVIYTSGSTGRPKGVQVSHHSAVGLLANGRQIFGFGASDAWAMFHSFAFDVSVWEVWGPLSTGAVSVLVDAVTARSPESFVDLLRRENVTILNQTPAAFYQIVAAESLDDLALRYVFVGGEELALEQVERWYGRRPDTTDSVIEMYGVTEATVIDSTATLPRENLADIPASVIGHPMPAVALHVLDDRLHPVPDGVVGGIYVAGNAVARGYVRRPGLTAARFVASPFADGRRMYRTGDLGRRCADGQLEFLGRSDFQVQVRGFRVELGEIESALLRCEGVARAVVVARRAEGSVGARVIGYVVPMMGHDLEPARVRERAGELLPEYMVPASVTVLDELPLTVNGKVDRKALPDPDFGAGATGGRAPEGDVEEALATLFAQVLEVPAVAADDSFFALGGDSIMVIQLVARARESGLTLTPQDVFEYPTVGRLARAVRADEAGGSVLDELDGGGVGRIEPTPIVRWLAERGDAWDHFSQSMTVAVPAEVNAADLEVAVQALLDAHDLLRAVRVGSGRAMHLDVPAPGAVPAARCLRRVDCTAVAEDADIDAAAAWERIAAVGRLDPAAGQMLEVVWCDAGTARPGRLAVAIHHLAVDGVSWRILLSDLMSAWQQIRAGEVPQLPPVGTSMRTWAHALSGAARGGDRADEIDWWTAALDPPDPSLGARRFDPDLDTTTCQSTRTLTVGLTRCLLQRLPEAYRATPADAVLYATVSAIGGWPRWDEDRTSVVVGVEGHGREEQVVPGADLSRTVGWFTTVFPVRFDVTGIDRGDVGAVLKTVKEQVRAVPDHGIGYGMLRYLDDEASPALAALEDPQISVNYLGRVGAGGVPGWTVAGGGEDDSPVGNGPVPSALAVDAVVSDGPDGPRLSATIRYVPTVLDADAAEEFAARWERAMEVLGEHLGPPDVGGLTPSDLDLVAATQREITRWERTHPGTVDVWPLSPLQEGLFFHALLSAGDVDAYHVQLVLTLDGDLDEDRLAGAAQVLMERHATLRTAFDNRDDGAVVQLLLRHVPVDWTGVDAATDTEADRIVESDQRRNFDMRGTPLIRFLLIRLGAGRFRLVVANHHSILDGWSMPLLIADLFELYAAGGADPGRALVPYRDYLAWLAARDVPAAERAWAGALSGLSGPTLVAAHTAGRQLSATASESVPLDDSTAEALARTAERVGVTLNTVLQAAWGILLGQMTAGADPVFGTTISGRPPAVEGVEAMVGLFINTVPVRVRLDPRETVQQLLVRLQSERTRLMPHEYLGLTDIQQAAGFGVLFDTAMVFESYPMDLSALARLTERTGLRVTDLTGNDSTHYPLSLMAFEDTELRLRLRYSPDAVDPAEVTDLARRLGRVVSDIAHRPSIPVGHIDLLGDTRRTELVDVADGTGVAPTTWPTILEQAAARDPGAVALRWQGSDVTYRELDEQSTRLARELISRGVGPEDFVPVAVPRSAESVTATWAVAKTGAAPVPIDPKLPAGRIEYMLGDCAAAVGLTATTDHALPGTLEWVALDHLDTDARPSTPIRDDERTHPIRPSDPAYLIYTSGSTGTPKGVVVTHTGLPHLTAAQVRHQHASPASRILHVCSPSFDVSILELMLAFGSGATLVVAPPDMYAGAELAEYARAEHVTHLLVTPAVCGTIDPMSVPDVQVVEVGGELFGAELVDAWAGRTCLLNAYGPTECTVCVTVSGALESGMPITMGAPLPRSGVGAVVLDCWLRPVPDGEEGELHLFGPGLARGYRGQAALTSERFVANPFGANGSRMYRTGDLVRRCGSEGFQYVGRTDFQIKIRGLRIEIGDVDAALIAHPDVEFAASLGHHAPNGETVLVSYVRLAPDSVADAAGLRKFAATSLPAYMVPSAITVLDEVPMNSNGKLDRAALPDPVFTAGAYRAPVTPVETVLADVFADVLGAERVGVDDSFFELGGNSLSAVRVVAEVQSRLGKPLPMQWLFGDPTPAAIAARVEGGDAPDPARQLLLRMRGGDGAAPLILVHPAIGLSWCYTGLVPYVPPSRPVYGLQSPGTVDGGHVAATIEDLASDYVDRIREVQPHGPYHLLGYSVGGAIAHAMAVRLRDLGEDVGALVMLDTQTADSVPEEARTPSLGMLFAEFAGLESSASGDGDLTPERAVQLLRDDEGPYSALTADDVRRLYADYVHTIALGQAYRPRVFDGDLVYIAAADGGGGGSPTPWNRFVSGAVHTHPVEHTHNRLTTPEAIAVIGPIVGSWLDGESR